MKYKDLLKQMTESAREEKELEEFKICLMNVAKEGKDVVNIRRLEQRFPTIYKNDRLWNWLGENDIHYSGSADSDGGNADYSFWWK